MHPDPGPFWGQPKGPTANPCLLSPIPSWGQKQRSELYRRWKERSRLPCIAPSGWHLAQMILKVSLRRKKEKQWLMEIAHTH